MEPEKIKEILGEMLNQVGLEFSDIAVAKEDKAWRIDISSSLASKIIGWHGETLNSFQHLLKAMLRTEFKLEEAPAIILDVDGYRRTQEDKVIGIAKRKIDYVRSRGKRVALPPMSPYFRRVVHMYIANDPALEDLTTESIGRGDYRQVVLRLKTDTRGAAEDGQEMQPVIEEEPAENGENGENEESWANLDV